MTYSETILADSPVGYWKLDETSGTVAADSSTNSNDGTIDGAPTMGANGLVFEPSGKCIGFDGVNDTISMGDVHDVGTGNFTIECWFNLGAAPATNNYFMGKSIAGADGGRYLIGVTSGGDFVASVTNTAQAVFDLGSTISTTVGLTQHIVYVVDRTGSATLYIDATPVGDVDISSFSADNLQNAIPLRFGSITNAGNSGADLYIDCKIQHAAIYDKALTPLQIRQHYQAGIAQGFHKEVLALNPTAYYPLNEASGDAIDWSGNDNNGTIQVGTTQASTGLLGYDDSNAYTLDGTSKTVEMGASLGNISYPLTIATWVNPASFTTGCSFFNSHTDDVDTYRGVSLGCNATTGNLNTLIGDGGASGPTNRRSATSSFSLVVGETSFVVAVINSATDTGFYVDGVLDTGEIYSGTGGAMNTAAGLPRIGDGGFNTNTVDGDMQGVVFFDNTALTPAQIRTLYQSGKALIESRGYPKVIQNLNPTGYWRLGEASGTTAFDESGNGNDGVINGSPVMATADSALHQSNLKAMTFDGTNDFVQTAYAGQAGSTTRTLMAWVRPSSLAAVNPVATYGTNTAADMFQLTVETDGKIKLDINGADVKGSTVLVVDTYYLITAVLTGADVNSIDLYVNGAVETEAYTSGATVLTTAASIDLRIGEDIGATLFFSGDMGEVGEIAAALTAQQIKQIYEAGKSRYAAEVISYEPTSYKRLNDASGSIVDYGSGGNAGTVVGGVTYSDSESPLSNEAGHTSLLFNGTTGYINEDGSEITVNADSTIIAWSKGGTTALESIYSSRDATSNSIYALRDDTDRKAWMLFRDSGSTDHHVDSTTLLSSSEWSMLCSSVDVAANEHKAYFDGAYEALTTGTFATGVSDADKAVIGATYGGGSYGSFYSGRISENAVWDGVVLTAPQILDIYEMASYSALETALTLFGIKGILSESVAEDKWIARTSKRDDGVLLDSHSWDGTGFYNVLTNQYEGAVDVTILQDIGLEWATSVVKVIGDRVYSSDAITNNYYFECTAAGTTDATTEPVWPASGTVVDGTVTWTWKGGLVRPIMHGPLKPTLIA